MDEHDLGDDGRSDNPSANPTFAAVLEARLSRRGFLAGAAAGLAALAGGPLAPRRPAEAQGLPFIPVVASKEDRLILPPGYAHTVLLRWGDPLFPGVPEFDPAAQAPGMQERQFGYDNDFLGFMPLPRGGADSARWLLGVNHENARSELMWPAWDGKAQSKTRETCEWSSLPTGSRSWRSGAARGASGRT